MVKAATRIKEAIADLIDRTTHLDVAEATEIIAKRLGLQERLVNYTHIELRNKLNEYGFKATPYSQRILFLPHCLRDSRHCKAKYTDYGLRCRRCGKCDIAKMIALSEELGYQGAFVAPGSSMVKKLIKKHKPKAIVGVSCYNEARLAFDSYKGKGIHGQASLLLYDGCKDTKANFADIEEKMRSIDESILNGKNDKSKG